MSAVAVEPWEVHSELTLVSAEVCERARELLPDRDPDALLAPRGRSRETQRQPHLATSLVGYTVLRLAETAQIALVFVALVVAFALLAQLGH